MSTSLKITAPLLFTLLVISCDRQADRVAASEGYAAMEPVSAPATKQEATPLTPTTERKLIKNGSMSFETDEVGETKAEIIGIATRLDAYLTNENQANYGDRLEYNMTIRVPASRFDTLIQRIESLAERLESKNIHTEDITEEFIDVEARLNTKKELESRYREILRQARTVEDILSVETEIGELREEIEAMEGRLNFLKNQVAFSTLQITLYQRIGVDFGFATKFVRSLDDGWDYFLSFVVGLAALWPFILIIGLGWWGVVVYKRRKKTAQAKS